MASAPLGAHPGPAMSTVARRPIHRMRHAAAALLTAVVLVLALAAGIGHATAGGRVNLVEGAAWLPSTTVGQVSLVSGASAEVMATLAAGSKGGDLSVVQSGSDAYVVDRSRGTVTRIDGGTFTEIVSAPFTDKAGAAQLQVFAGGGRVYVLDGARGLLTSMDPHTFAPGSARILNATGVDPGSAVVDGAGRLWIFDNAAGQVKWFDPGQGQGSRPVQGHDLKLVLAAGAPVLVDATGASWLARDGSTQARVQFLLRTGDRAQVSGTPDGRLLLVIAQQRVVEVCSRDRCDPEVYALSAGAGSELGPAVLDQGVIALADLTTGALHVLSTATHREIGSPVVLEKPSPDLELFDVDSTLFYDDASGDRAGVLRLDGEASPVQKYLPGDPSRAVDTAAAAHTASTLATTAAPASRSGLPTTQSGSATGPTNIGVAQTTGGGGAVRTGDPTGGGGTSDGGASTTETTATTASTTGGAGAGVLTVGAAHGAVTSHPAGIACPSQCSFRFNDGTPVTLTETPAAGWTFSGWTGPGTCGTGITCVVTVTGAVQEGATYVPAASSLTVTVAGTGVVRTDTGTSCSTTCRIDESFGRRVILTAVGPADKTWSFHQWSEPNCGTAPTCTVTVQGARGVTATFTKVGTAILSIAVIGQGSVSGASGALACPADCQADITLGSSVTLTAGPAQPGWVFSGWGAAAPCGKQPSCTFTVGMDMKVSATFLATLTVTMTGGGAYEGLVTSNSVELTCSGVTCTAEIAQGTSVTMSAAPQDGRHWAFDGWSGPLSCSSSSSCTFTMNGPVAESVTFVLNTELQISVKGGGNVTGPDGINCPAVKCTSILTESEITLTATATDGTWLFTGWSSNVNCSGQAPTCTFSPLQGQQTSVTATFARAETLTVVITGRGSVTSSPAGINCPGTCSYPFAQGTSVQLSGMKVLQISYFSGFSQGSGTCISCPPIVMEGAVVENAYFSTDPEMGMAPGDTHTFNGPPVGTVQLCFTNVDIINEAHLTFVPSVGDLIIGPNLSACVRLGGELDAYNISDIAVVTYTQ